MLSRTESRYGVDQAESGDKVTVGMRLMVEGGKERRLEVYEDDEDQTLWTGQAFVGYQLQIVVRWGFGLHKQRPGFVLSRDVRDLFRGGQGSFLIPGTLELI